MRVITPAVLSVMLFGSLANAQLTPDQIGQETMSDPGPNWFISKTGEGAYIFDAESGEMQGLLSLSGRYATGVRQNEARKEFYSAEMYYSRGVYGERADLVVVYDYENLSPIAEIEIPQKMAVLSLAGHLGLTGNGKFLTVFNMTPGQSVSVVDVETRQFVSEISTAGCAIMMPVSDRDFMMICGDGTLQLIGLDEQGNESNRERSEKFFDIDGDPIFDRPEETVEGWLLVSHAGLAFHVVQDGSQMSIGEPWSIVGEDDTAEKWLPGGQQLYAVHKESGLLYILMHQGDEYSHHDYGTEIWVLDIDDGHRVARIELETPASHVMVTQESNPKLVVADEEGGLHIYDALKMKLERTIEDPGPGPSLFTDL